MMEKFFNFMLSWAFNLHKLLNIYTSVAIQWLERRLENGN